MVFYITESQAIEVHKKTIEYSGGGDLGVVNIGYLYSALEQMENISYHLAAGRIEKELLQKLIHSFLAGEDDFSEELKLEYLLASSR